MKLKYSQDNLHCTDLVEPDMHPTLDMEEDFLLDLAKALVAWQQVESSAFGLFRAFMGNADQKLVSVTFHHIQSFTSAIKLLDQCAYFILTHEHMRARWGGEGNNKPNIGLRKRLADQTEVRNRLVHFRYHTGATDGKPVIDLGPSFFDATYAYKDRWKNPENWIDHGRLLQARTDFEKLAGELSEFIRDVHAHYPATTNGETAQLK